MNNNNNGLLVILSGPSGSGKDTILTELTKRDMNIKVSTSMTTRKKREWEVDGIHYYFVDKDYFMRKIDEGQVLEYAQYGINYYGTPKAPVDELLAQGRTVFLKIEVQGAEKIRKLYPEAVSIFLMPPSMAALEERLRCRESEDEEDIQRPLTRARARSAGSIPCSPSVRRSGGSSSMRTAGSCGARRCSTGRTWHSSSRA